MRDLDPAFTGAGQKAYPLSHEIFSIFTIVDICVLDFLVF